MSGNVEQVAAQKEIARIRSPDGLGTLDRVSQGGASIERPKVPATGGAGASSVALLATLFVGSGFSALVYQVALGRYAQLIVGATARAISTVLVAFMLGTSLGAALGGRWADRSEASVLEVDRILREWGYIR
jgi:hypothetical protein